MHPGLTMKQAYMNAENAGIHLNQLLRLISGVHIHWQQDALNAPNAKKNHGAEETLYATDGVKNGEFDPRYYVGVALDENNSMLEYFPLGRTADEFSVPDMERFKNLIF